MDLPANPDMTDLMAAFERGRFDDVARNAPACLDGSAGDELVLTMLGAALLGLQRPEDAVSAFAAATQRFPAVALHWNNLGTAVREAGRPGEAHAAYAEAVRLEPANGGYRANLGFLYLHLDRVADAATCLWRASRLDPGNIEARVYGARALLDCGDDSRALRLVDDWQAWGERLTPELAVELATQLLQLDRGDEGERLLRRHVAHGQSGLLARTRLVALLERTNRVAEARDILAGLPLASSVADATLAGELAEARAMMAVREKDFAFARTLLEQRLAQVQVARWRVSALFLLAKVCDGEGDYLAAMEYLARAHSTQVGLLRQWVPELVAPGASHLRVTDNWLQADQVALWAPPGQLDAVASPVFIVGFPRSGTTMLEQMLDAHPALQSMDERAFLYGVVDAMADMGLAYPDGLGALPDDQAHALRQHYWRAVHDVVRLSPGQRLVDKNPLNMLLLPLIVRLFPRAQIVFAVRHPCDVVLSCYMQQFRAPRFAALCATPDALAGGYAKAMRFWWHHAALLGPRCMEWRYEDAIRDFDGCVVRLAAFLQLDDAAPLREFSTHAQRKGYISTPSYAQVVRRPYADSIGHWERYRGMLDAIVPTLRPALQHWGYDA